MGKGDSRRHHPTVSRGGRMAAAKGMNLIGKLLRAVKSS
jgi:hypothetical protein